MWRPPPSQALGAGRCWGWCPQRVGHHKEKLGSFSEEGEATSAFSEHMWTWAWGSRCHGHALQADSSCHRWSPTTLSHSLAAPPPGRGRHTGLGTQHTSEPSRLALYSPHPSLPFAACAVDPLNARARHLFLQIQLERMQHKLCLGLGQLSSSSLPVWAPALPISSCSGDFLSPPPSPRER